MQDTALEFTPEEKDRLDAWYAAGKPGAAHNWLGLSADEYDVKRSAARASIERFLDSPTGSMMLNIIWAHRNADAFRWEDDGGPPLPDGFRGTPDVRGWHVRADYAARRLF